MAEALNNTNPTPTDEEQVAALDLDLSPHPGDEEGWRRNFRNGQVDSGLVDREMVAQIMRQRATEEDPVGVVPSRSGRNRQVFAGADGSRGMVESAPDGQSLVELNRVAQAEARARQEADAATLSVLDDSIIERYGAAELLAARYAGEANDDSETLASETLAAMKHASTGESLTPQEAQQRIDEVAASRVGNVAERAAESVSLAVEAVNSEVYVIDADTVVGIDTYELGDSENGPIKAQIVHDFHTGELVSMRIISSESGEVGDGGEPQTFDVIASKAGAEVQVNGELSKNPDDAERVAEFLEYTTEAVDDVAAKVEAEKTAAEAQARADAEAEADQMRADAEAARAAIESSEAHNSSELAPVAESVLPTTVAEHLGKNEPLPVVERTEEVMNTPEQLKQTKPDKEVEVAQKHSVAEDEKTGRAKSYELTEEERSQHTTRYLAQLWAGAGTRPVMAAALKESGVDPALFETRFKSGEFAADLDTLKKVKSLIHELNPQSSIWENDLRTNSQEAKLKKSGIKRLELILGKLNISPDMK